MHVLMLGKDYSYSYALGAMGAEMSAITAWQGILIQWTAGTNLQQLLSKNNVPNSEAVAEDLGVRVQRDGVAAAARYAADIYGAPKGPGNAAINEAGTLIKQYGPEAIDTVLSILKQKYGLTDTDAKSAVKHATLGETLMANMPWLILGGAALVAVLFMVGTRRR